MNWVDIIFLCAIVWLFVENYYLKQSIWLLKDRVKTLEIMLRPSKKAVNNNERP